MKVKVTFSINPGKPAYLDDDNRLCRLLIELNGGGLSEAQVIKAMLDLAAIQDGEVVRLGGKHLGVITIERNQNHDQHQP